MGYNQQEFFVRMEIKDRLNNTLLSVFFLLFSATLYGQKSLPFADSIQRTYRIPELSYAVVSSDSILEIASIGHHAINLKDTATINDRFHIGSNTKAMTAFIIAKYIEKRKLKWNTKFFSLFPKWKATSNPDYYNITLQDLLSHRARIQPFQEEDDSIPSFKGNKQEMRRLFGKYVLTLPAAKVDTVTQYTYSNAGYTLATLMLEKVSGQSWEQLVQEVFNKALDIDVKFSWPENQKNKGTWGHTTEDGTLTPVPSDTDYQLNYTEPAGDINVTLPDYIKFIQLNLQGLQGKNNYLRSTTYQFIHKGLKNYAIGWFNSYENNQDFSTHAGTAGTYYTLVAIDRNKYIGYIIFSNSFNEETVSGVRSLMRKLKAVYGS